MTTQTNRSKRAAAASDTSFALRILGAWALACVALCALALLLGGCDPKRHHDGGSSATLWCGGIAGVQCPGAGICTDDPHDDCDPQSGGADCGGFCECNALGVCIEGMVWDSSPFVCGCVPEAYDPCIATLCPIGTTCINQDGHGVCVELDGGVRGERCGAIECDPGLVCCNASCGICTEPGGVCTQMACEG